MRICLHIGLEHVGAARLQSVLAKKREALLTQGVLFAQSPGSKNHTRLYMAVTDPDHVDPLRYNRGYATANRQADLRANVIEELEAEIAKAKPETLILSAAQLGVSLARREELERLKDLLGRFSDKIELVAHIDEPARLLVRHYAEQIMEGRAQSLEAELALAGSKSWWQSALTAAPRLDPLGGQFLETQAPAFWLDFAALVAHWDGVFGKGALRLRAFDPAGFASKAVVTELKAAFGIAEIPGGVPNVEFGAPAPAAWLTRGRQMNRLLLQMLEQRKRLLPRQVWREIIAETRIEGAPIEPGSLATVSEHFAFDIKEICARYDIDPALLIPDAPLPGWREADPEFGYRASQYLLASMWRIDQANRALLKASEAPREAAPELTETAREIMPPLAQRNFGELTKSRFAPHNRLGIVREEDLAIAYDAVPARKLPKGSSGNLIVACMKNEAPYILEWVAYHRAMGVDNFLIYTNGCTDGTDEILGRLDALGIVHHRDNDDWKGKSPQQHALNQALKEPVLQQAEWIIHIDVDEFINVRCGNGTLQDFFEAVPEATNVAMTWRLFGHNGVRDLRDDFVISQFDTCAPKFCPKPHTVWGFKTMVRNIGAYAKLSCHRPNKLDPDWRDKVLWVNGSGQDITREVAEKGWRSSMRSVGYELLQLNHYALRSAESFLIKRQRGRALHVDRSIGLNYWIRMDWSVHQDVTIQRNLPRLKSEYDRLLQDDSLRALHENGRAWHRAKADELHNTPEFRDLYDQALQIKLTATERVAYALALDMET